MASSPSPLLYRDGNGDDRFVGVFELDESVGKGATSILQSVIWVSPHHPCESLMAEVNVLVGDREVVIESLKADSARSGRGGLLRVFEIRLEQ
jgi:hypothetical protein